MGGEKSILTGLKKGPAGSPPRGRGKDKLVRYMDDVTRITPAWAGKRYYPFAVILLDRDHPRVGGEKSPVRIKALPNSGSPPRGRGKAQFHCSASSKSRITPAWAGKSTLRYLSALGSGDHPRVGGEKFSGIWV